MIDIHIARLKIDSRARFLSPTASGARRMKYPEKRIGSHFAALRIDFPREAD